MIDEDKLLKNFARILGADEVLNVIEEKKVKEQSLIKNLASSLGVTDVLTEMERKQERERRLLENFSKVLRPEPIAEPEPVVEEESPVEVAITPEPEPIVEDTKQVEPELPKDNIINKTVVAISKAAPQEVQRVVDDIPDSYRKELDIIKKSIADFHRFAQRHSQLGGGGAGSVDELTFNTTVTTTNYQIGRKDYYVGVNHTAPVTITLPSLNLKAGRQVVVKDETGHCNVNNITIVAPNGDMIDNNTSAVLAINNGSLTFIYRNGWRII